MWQHAVDRQYNLFGTLIIFLVTVLSIIGSIIGTSSLYLNLYEKIIFSTISIILGNAVILLLRMVHIERKVAFIANPPKSTDAALQNEENLWRWSVNVSIAVATILTLFLVNVLVWHVDQKTQKELLHPFKESRRVVR